MLYSTPEQQEQYYAGIAGAQEFFKVAIEDRPSRIRNYSKAEKLAEIKEELLQAFTAHEKASSDMLEAFFVGYMERLIHIHTLVRLGQ